MNDVTHSYLAAKEKIEANLVENQGKLIYQKIFQAQLVGFYDQLKVLNRAEATLREYRGHLGLFLDWLVQKGIYNLKEVSEELLRAYQAEISTRNYKPHTIHVKLRSIKRFFEYLEKTNQLLYNPTGRLIFPKLGDRLPQHILTENEMARLLDSPNTSLGLGIRDKTLLELMYSTGIRLEECVNLTIHDVDYEGGYLRVNLGKGGKDRVVPIGKKACNYLKEYLLKVRVKYLKDRDERALFLTKDGRPMTGKAIRAQMRTYAQLADIQKPVSPHAFRRSFATHMLKNGAHPVYIQRILGHAYSSVLNRYIKVANMDLKKTHRKTHPREKNRRLR